MKTRLFPSDFTAETRRRFVNGWPCSKGLKPLPFWMKASERRTYV